MDDAEHLPVCWVEFEWWWIFFGWFGCHGWCGGGFFGEFVKEFGLNLVGQDACPPKLPSDESGYDEAECDEEFADNADDGR